MEPYHTHGDAPGGWGSEAGIDDGGGGEGEAAMAARLQQRPCHTHAASYPGREGAGV